MSFGDANNNVNGTPVPFETLIGVTEVAKLLDLSCYTVREMSRRAKLPAIRIGRRYRYSPTAVRRWLERQTVR